MNSESPDLCILRYSLEVTLHNRLLDVALSVKFDDISASSATKKVAIRVNINGAKSWRELDFASQVKGCSWRKLLVPDDDFTIVASSHEGVSLGTFLYGPDRICVLLDGC